jgi:hypothetical protein
VSDVAQNPDAPEPPAIPAWVADDSPSFPLTYERNDDGTKHRMILGNPNERRAVVISGRGPFQIPTEELVSLAAGAFETVAGKPCTRESAEVIAKGWMLACRRALQ